MSPCAHATAPTTAAPAIPVAARLRGSPLPGGLRRGETDRMDDDILTRLPHGRELERTLQTFAMMDAIPDLDQIGLR